MRRHNSAPWLRRLSTILQSSSRGNVPHLVRRERERLYWSAGKRWLATRQDILWWGRGKRILERI
jgi:hypothetical protein